MLWVMPTSDNIVTPRTTACMMAITPKAFWEQQPRQDEVAAEAQHLVRAVADRSDAAAAHHALDARFLERTPHGRATACPAAS